MSEYSDDQWLRVGRLLEAHRVHVDPRFFNRQTFCEVTGLNYKLVQEFEGAKRTNFGPTTLARFEVAYRLRPGSLERMLAGGELEPLPMETGGEGVQVPASPAKPEESLADLVTEFSDLENFEPESEYERRMVLLYRAAKRELEIKTAKQSAKRPVRSIERDEPNSSDQGASGAKPA